MEKRSFIPLACVALLCNGCLQHLGSQRVFIDRYDDLASAISSWKKQNECREETNPRWFDLSSSDVGFAYDYSISGIDECVNEGRVKDDDSHPKECLYLHDRQAWGCVISKTYPSSYAAIRFLPVEGKEFYEHRMVPLDPNNKDDRGSINYWFVSSFFPYSSLPFKIDSDSDAFYIMKSGDVSLCVIEFTSNASADFKDGVLNYLKAASAQS